MARPTKLAAPSSTPLNNQQTPRPAYKQLPPQQSQTSTQQIHPQQLPQTSKTAKRDRFQDDFYTDENYKEPPDTEENEQEDLFPVKKKRPRAVVY